ncbi:trypsin-like serine peptidase [Marinirhabdus gelatinilytica]|nr:serine protease [Marinirhabdus gelatinilytica]
MAQIHNELYIEEIEEEQETLNEKYKNDDTPQEGYEQQKSEQILYYELESKQQEELKYKIKKIEYSVDGEAIKNYLKQQQVEIPAIIQDSEEEKDSTIVKSTNEAAQENKRDNHYKKDNNEQKSRTLFGVSRFDSRIEFAALDANYPEEKQMLLTAKSVGMIVEKKQLKKVSKNYYQLNTTRTLANTYNVCPETAFKEQPIAGVGTAFVIGDNQFITAKHVFEKDPKKYAIVFGYKVLNKINTVENIIAERDIYFVEKITKSSNQLDICEFTTNKQFYGIPLSIEKQKQAKFNTSVYMIGHPLGLPKKLTLKASINKADHPQYFLTTLDSFAGNSGSPVFDKTTHKVIGVMVSGELDFIFNGTCYKEKSCSPPYCLGEKVVRITSFIN